MQALFQFLDGKPVSVEGHHVRSAILIVVPAEVFTKPFEDVVCVVVVQHTLIQIRTVSSFEVFDVMSI